MAWCEVCKGRGEVGAGIEAPNPAFDAWQQGGGIGDFLEGPRGVLPNPDAIDDQHDYLAMLPLADRIWYVRENPMLPLWGVALCMRCHGTGMTRGTLD